MTILIVIISISIIILVHELGHFYAARIFKVRVEEFGLGFPPKIFSKKKGETEYSVNLLPFGGFVKIYGENGEDIKNDTKKEKGDSFSSRPIWKRSVIILSGITMNVLFGWLLLSAVFMAGMPKHLAITNISKESPADIVGIKGGDIILEIRANNSTLKDPIASKDFIELIKNNSENNIFLQIKRGKNLIEFNPIPRKNPPEGEGPIGVELMEIGLDRESIPLSFIKAAEATISMLKLLVISFFKLFTGIFIHPQIIKNVSGPVGMLAMTAEASSMGIVYLLQLMALISLNLAVLNFFPLPALDGGRFLFLIIEKIKKRPIALKTQTIINSIGFAALILLMIAITIKDISNLIN